MSATSDRSLATPHGVARALDAVTKLCFNLSGLALAVLLLLVVNEVCMRYFFNSPTNWSMDVNQWLLAVATMLALPEITRVNGNVAITILLERMTEERRIVASRIIALLSCLACLVAFYIAGSELVRQFTSHIMTTWVHPIPKWWISVCIPCGFLLSAMQFLRLGLTKTPQSQA